MGGLSETAAPLPALGVKPRGVAGRLEVNGALVRGGSRLRGSDVRPQEDLQEGPT